MFKISTYLTVFATVIFACSTKDQIGVSDHNLSYELMKMQEQGKIDSTLIGIAISSADEQIVRDAIKTCGIIRDNYFISEIERFLLNPNKEIRESAIFALGEIRDTSTINYIAGVLHIEEFRAQLEAIEALGKIGDKRAAPFIIPLLSRNDDEAYEAALALWRMADTSSIVFLRESAKNGSGKALSGAIYAMFRLAPDSSLPEFNLVFEIISPGDSISSWTRSVAARGLGAGNDTTAVLAVFKNKFDSLSRQTKIELIRSMGQTGAGRKELEQLLADTDDNGIRRVILLALGRIGNSKSKKIVEKYIHYPSLEVQLAAISVIPDIDKKSPTNSLEKLKSENSWQVRAEVAKALGKVKSNRSLKSLRLMLEDRDDRVKAAVIEGLGQFSISRNIDILKAALNGSRDIVVKSVTADVLGASGNSKALDILIEAASKNTKTEEIDFARSLVSALANFVDTTQAGQNAVENIRSFLDHPDRIVRQDANKALGKWGVKDFDPGIFKVDFSEADYEKIKDLYKSEIIANIETDRGMITVNLNAKWAPRTTANFVRLAERGFYDDLTFHRVVQDFVVQGGCPRGDGWGGPGYMIREEINPIKFKRGTIGMATSGRDTGGSQFFICLSDQPHLDGRYTAFGHVIEGWEILDRIEIGDKIKSIVIEKGRY